MSIKNTHSSIPGLNHQLLTRDDEQQLLDAYATGSSLTKRRARDKLIASNMRLISSIAKRYSRYAEMQDLMQEGSIGLMRALELFKANKGAKFTTYATWWIRQAIIQFITNKSSNVRLPAHVHSIKRKISKHNLGSMSPTLLASKLGISIEMATASINASTASVSLDAQKYDSSESDGACLGAFVSDRNSISQSDAYDHIELVNIIRNALGTLTPREEVVLRLRFGIGVSNDDKEKWHCGNFIAANDTK